LWLYIKAPPCYLNEGHFSTYFEYNTVMLYAGGGAYWLRQRNVWSLYSQPCVKELAPLLPAPCPQLTPVATRLSSVRTKRKIFSEPWCPLVSADLRFLSPQPDTDLYCETWDTELVHSATCPFTLYIAFASKLPIAFTHEKMARLSWSGWLAVIIPRWLSCPNTATYRCYAGAVS